MTEDIQFIKQDTSKHDLDCANGEIRPPKDLILCEDGRLAPAPQQKTLTNLPTGIRPLFIHNQGDTTNLIATDGDVLIWAPMPDGHTVISPDSFTIITEVTDIKDIAILNNRIIFATDDGMMYLTYTESGYTCVQHIKTPEIEFGLQKAGNLSNATTISLPASTIDTGNGTLPNTTETSDRTYAADISDKVAKIFNEAVTSQIITKGYFHMPFLIRYALRLYDGSHIMPSSPILMLPTVLPPCIGLTITTDNNEGITQIKPSLSRIIYHQLRYRIKTAYIENLKSIVNAIDIFATPMISTFDISLMDQGYITTYSRAINSALSPIRGRQPNMTNGDTLIYDGHYSSTADNYTDHYLEQSVLDSTVLMVYPNTKFHNQITNASEFNLIASIPISDVSQNNVFSPVPLNTLPDSTSSQSKLNDSPLSIFDIRASALHTINSKLLVAVKSFIPKPESIPLGFPYYGNVSSEETIATEIIVHIKNGNQNCRITYRKQLGYHLSSYFPRYLFFPHTGAYKICLRQGESQYCLDLTPNPSLKGAYWYGGTCNDAAPTPISADPTTDDASAEIYTDTLLVSADNNPFVFDESNSISFDGAYLTGIAEATKAPKYGTFGKYPAYIFTTAGIWMLEYSDTQSRYISRQKISRDNCPYHAGVIEASDAIIFATDSQIKRLDGTDVQTISSGIESMVWDITSLPHWDQLLEIGKMEQIETSLPEILRTGVMAYHEQLSMLMISPKEADYTLAYRNGLWSVLDFGISSIVKTNSTSLYLYTTDGSLCTIDNPQSQTKAMVITRPIRCSYRKIKSIRILGNFTKANVATAVYGTYNYGDWHLCASSRSYYTKVDSTEQFRYYIIVVIAELKEHEYLTGASIEYDP